MNEETSQVQKLEDSSQPGLDTFSTLQWPVWVESSRWLLLAQQLEGRGTQTPEHQEGAGGQCLSVGQ